jgi:hypothetical protein
MVVKLIDNQNIVRTSDTQTLACWFHTHLRCSITPNQHYQFVRAMPFCKMFHKFMRPILYGCDGEVFNQGRVMNSHGKVTSMVRAQAEWDALSDKVHGLGSTYHVMH